MDCTDISEKNIIIEKYIGDILTLLDMSSTVLPSETTVNIYHHMGISELYRTGAMFMNIVNKDYCKSYVIMTSGQKYPDHYHRIKTESFFILYGRLCVTLDDKQLELSPGDILHINRNENHSFCTDTGTVFEELSTMYVPNDSVYIDEDIAHTSYADRRTTIKNEQWKEIVGKWKR